jgi:integrase
VPGKRKGLSCKEDALSRPQIDQLWSICSSVRDRFIVGVLILAGMRVSELTHLKKSWVDFDQNIIIIPIRQFCTCWECLKYRKGEWRPKTKQGARTIRIHPLLKPILHEYLAGRYELGLTRQRVWQHVKELAYKAQILHDCYPHCLRSTAAIELAHTGISSAALQYLLGWARLSSAENYVRSDMHRALKEYDEPIHV